MQPLPPQQQSCVDERGRRTPKLILIEAEVLEVGEALVVLAPLHLDGCRQNVQRRHSRSSDQPAKCRRKSGGGGARAGCAPRTVALPFSLAMPRRKAPSASLASGSFRSLLDLAKRNSFALPAPVASCGGGARAGFSATQAGVAAAQQQPVPDTRARRVAGGGAAAPACAAPRPGPC